MPRRSSWTYLLPLAVIAAISLTTLALTSSIIRQNRRQSFLLTQAFRQRTQLQAIARIAEGVADKSIGRDAGNQQLMVFVERMQHEETQLIEGDSTAHVPPMTDATARHIYFDPPINLHRQVVSFLQNARTFAANPSPSIDDPALRAMVTAAQAPLPSGLDIAISSWQNASDHAIRHLQHVIATLTGTMLLALAFEAIFVYRPLFRRQRETIATLKESATTDELTDVLNRGAFMQCLERELARGSRMGQPACILLADIDRFRLLNDRFGAEAGDLTLKHFAASAQINLRAGDSLGRLGGEEFALILPSTDLQGGILAAERIRQRFAGTSAAVVPGGQRVTATVSIGVLCTLGAPISEALEQADRLLSQAKANGRNRVESTSIEREIPQGSTPSPAPESH